MNTDDLIRDAVHHGIGFPVYTSGRYCTYRKSFTLVLSTGENLQIAFEHMELNDITMFKKHDELYHMTAILGDTQVYHQATETLTPEDMRLGIKKVLAQLESPQVVTVTPSAPTS